MTFLRSLMHLNLLKKAGLRVSSPIMPTVGLPREHEFSPLATGGRKSWWRQQRHSWYKVSMSQKIILKLWHKLPSVRFSHVQLFTTPWTVSCQASLFMGLSRQEYWRGFPCPSPGDLPHPGIKSASLTSPALVSRFFSTSTTWEAQ